MVEQKVHLNSLGLIIGTKCNLRCPHCLGGDPSIQELPIEYIDRIIDNIYGIDQLKFLGYEITLYIDKVREILQRFAESKVKISKLIFYTNGVVYSGELVNLFNDFRRNHTVYPEEAILQLSVDDFHFNSGFTWDKLYDNLKKYVDATSGCDFRLQTLDNGLFITGRAKNLKASDIVKIDKVICPNVQHNPIEFRTECRGNQNTCNNGNCVKNCLVSELILTPKGYLFCGDVKAFRAIDTDDYSLAIGHINSDPLYNMIMNYQNQYKSIPISKDNIFKDITNPMWNAYHLIHRYLQYKDNIYDLLRNGDGLSKSDYYKKRKAFYSVIDDFKNKIATFAYTITDEKVYCNHLYNIILLECAHVDAIAEKRFANNADNQTIIELNLFYITSQFNRFNFKKMLGLAMIILN